MATTLAQAVAKSIRELRTRRGWTAQKLADECQAAGSPSLDRNAVAAIENLRRQRIGIDEVFALAYALDVSPLRLLLPPGTEGLVEVVPTAVVTARQARLWVRGDEQLPGRDAETFRVESPEVGDVPDLARRIGALEQWASIVQGAESLGLEMHESTRGTTAAPITDDEGGDDAER